MGSRSIRRDKVEFNKLAKTLVASHEGPAVDDIEGMAATLIAARYGTTPERGLEHFRAVPAVKGVWLRMARAALAYQRLDTDAEAKEPQQTVPQDAVG